jgi:hypothetical protein
MVYTDKKPSYRVGKERVTDRGLRRGEVACGEEEDG